MSSPNTVLQYCKTVGVMSAEQRTRNKLDHIDDKAEVPECC